jgi:hypothetical protein
MTSNKHKIAVAFGRSFKSLGHEDRNPAGTDLLSRVQFTGDEINGWIVEMFENKRGPFR